MHLIEAGCNGMNWTQLAEDIVHRLTFVLIMMNAESASEFLCAGL